MRRRRRKSQRDGHSQSMSSGSSLRLFLPPLITSLLLFFFFFLSVRHSGHKQKKEKKKKEKMYNTNTQCTENIYTTAAVGECSWIPRKRHTHERERKYREHRESIRRKEIIMGLALKKLYTTMYIIHRTSRVSSTMWCERPGSKGVFVFFFVPYFAMSAAVQFSKEFLLIVKKEKLFFFYFPQFKIWRKHTQTH